MRALDLPPDATGSRRRSPEVAVACRGSRRASREGRGAPGVSFSSASRRRLSGASHRRLTGVSCRRPPLTLVASPPVVSPAAACCLFTRRFFIAAHQLSPPLPPVVIARLLLVISRRPSHAARLTSSPGASPSSSHAARLTSPQPLPVSRLHQALTEYAARLTFVASLCSCRSSSFHVSRSSPAPSTESAVCLSTPVASCQFFVGLLFCTLIFFSALSAVALATSIAADHRCCLCEANTSSFVSSGEMKSSPFSRLITKMNGGNYEMWAMQVKRTLIAHDKEHLILEPEPVQKDIANEVLHKESAKDMWDSLAATYSQARNETRIMQLHHDIHQMRQDGRPLHTYYSSLKSMFERLNNYFPACKCEQQKAYRDMLMVGVFLSGLDSVYESAKNQMLTSPSIPPIDKAYSRLSRIRIPVANVPDTTSAMLATRGRGGSFFPRGRGGSGPPTSRPVCQFCHRIGHTVDKCWQKHGRPAFANQTASTESPEQLKAQHTAPSSELRVDDLLSQLRSLIGDRPQHALDPTTTTVTTAASAFSSGMYSAFTACPATDTTDWLIDSGASTHLLQSSETESNTC
ncbi:hypothetical protein EJ110_NYTH58619 [Nymphaea thermarum]|nr:hypothetical protein EJ110_NYTH58619 [Nymphaea thermarum]